MSLLYAAPGDDLDEDKVEEKDSFEDLKEDEFDDVLSEDDYGDGDTDDSWPSGKKDTDAEEEVE